MNLDEMLAASGITGGAAANQGNVKSGFVTLIGRPNVGKSTLMNKIIGYRQCLLMNGDRLYLWTLLVFTKRRISLESTWLELLLRRCLRWMLYAGW